MKCCIIYFLFTCLSDQYLKNCLIYEIGICLFTYAINIFFFKFYDNKLIKFSSSLDIDY